MADDTDTPDQGAASSAPPAWEDVADTFNSAFPGTDPEENRKLYGQALKLRQARQDAANTTETVPQKLARQALPFASAGIGVGDEVSYARSKARYEAGQAEDDDLHAIAEHEQRQVNDQRSMGTWAGALTRAGYGAAAMGGEAVVGAKVLSGAAGVAPKALGFLAPEAGEAAQPLARQAAAGLGRAAAQTALMPSTFAEQGVQRNVAAGQATYDPRGIGTAFGLATAQTAVLGQIGKYTDKLLPGEGAAAAFGRTALAGGSFPVYQAAQDVVTSAVGLDTGYGTVGDILRGDPQGALRNATVQALTAAAFHAAHGGGQEGAERVVRQFAEQLQAQAKGGAPADAAGRAMLFPHQLVGGILQHNPDPNRITVEQAVGQMDPGPSRDWGATLASLFPETAPGHKPAGGVQPAEGEFGPQGEAALQRARQPAPQQQAPPPAAPPGAPAEAPPSSPPTPPAEPAGPPGMDLETMRSALKALGLDSRKMAPEKVRSEAKRLGIDQGEVRKPQAVQPQKAATYEAPPEAAPQAPPGLKEVLAGWDDPAAQTLLRHPQLDEIAKHVPPGSKPLGAGGSSVALRTPEGDVVRVGLNVPRPAIPEVLQPKSRQVVRRTTAVERLPFVDTKGITGADVQEMAGRLKARGYELVDPQPENLGRTADGRLVVLDAGAVAKAEGKAEGAEVTLHHGTQSAFDRFDPARAHEETGVGGRGFFFSENPEAAKFHEGWGGTGTSPRTVSVNVPRDRIIDVNEARARFGEGDISGRLQKEGFAGVYKPATREHVLFNPNEFLPAKKEPPTGGKAEAGGLLGHFAALERPHDPATLGMVSMADLRERSGLPRAEFDRQLKQLRRDGVLRFVGVGDPGVLPAREKAAWIEGPSGKESFAHVERGPEFPEQPGAQAEERPAAEAKAVAAPEPKQGTLERQVLGALRGDAESGTPAEVWRTLNTSRKAKGLAKLPLADVKAALDTLEGAGHVERHQFEGADPIYVPHETIGLTPADVEAGKSELYGAQQALLAAHRQAQKEFHESLQRDVAAALARRGPEQQASVRRDVERDVQKSHAALQAQLADEGNRPPAAAHPGAPAADAVPEAAGRKLAPTELARRGRAVPKQYEQEAVEAGIDPEHLHSLAREIQREDRPAVEQHNQFLTRAEQLYDHFTGRGRENAAQRREGKGLPSLRGLARKGKTEDPASVPSWDVISRALHGDGRFAGMLSEENHAEEALARYNQGRRKPVGEEGAYRQALDFLVERKGIEDEAEKAQRSGSTARAAGEAVRSGQETGEAERFAEAEPPHPPGDPEGGSPAGDSAEPDAGADDSFVFGANAPDEPAGPGGGAGDDAGAPEHGAVPPGAGGRGGPGRGDVKRDLFGKPIFESSPGKQAEMFGDRNWFREGYRDAAGGQRAAGLPENGAGPYEKGFLAGRRDAQAGQHGPEGEDRAVWQAQAVGNVERPFGAPLTAEERRAGTLGGGQPGANETPPKQWTVALANARIDQERQANQLPPLLAAARRENTAVWDRAMATLEHDPEAGKKLVDELAAKPRATTVDENALLLQRQVALRNEHTRAMLAAIEASKPGAKADAVTWQALVNREESLLAEIDKTDKVARSTGTEWGRAGQFRRQLAAEDFSLAGMLLQAQAARPNKPLTPEEKSLILTLQKQIETLQGQLSQAQAAYRPPEGRPTAAEVLAGAKPLQQAATQLAGAKGQWQQTLQGFRSQNMSAAQRLASLWLRVRRAELLSSPATLAKIAAAAAERSVLTPLEEAAGSAWSQIPGIAKIAALAPRQGRGLNLAAEKGAFLDTFGKGMQDAWQTLQSWRQGKGGASDLDLLYGNKRAGDSGWLELPGVLHAALKAPIKRGEYTRSMLQRIDFALKNGQDATSPAALSRIGLEAYKDAQRAVFMQDNAVVDAYRGAVNRLRAGGTPGKVAAGVLDTALPIVRVPTNVIGETLEHIAGVPIGITKVLSKGAAGLGPEQADVVMRQLKKGSLGAAVLALGILAPKQFGGLYQGDEKRKPGDVKPGAARTPVGDVPALLQHHPLLMTAQVGATFRRVLDAEYKKQGYAAVPLAAVDAAVSTGEETPFLREPAQLAKMADAKERGYAFGQFAKGLAVPALFDWMAKGLDVPKGQTPFVGQPVKRSPRTITQHLETGVPGLRQRVPPAKSQR